MTDDTRQSCFFGALLCDGRGQLKVEGKGSNKGRIGSGGKGGSDDNTGGSFAERDRKKWIAIPISPLGSTKWWNSCWEIM